ncbi:unnamed protein product [Brassica rapa subsp. trilocularis]
MNGSLWWFVSDLGSSPFTLVVSLGSLLITLKNHVSLSVDGLLRRRDRYHSYSSASMSPSSAPANLLLFSSFDLVSVTVRCSLSHVKPQLLQSSYLSPPSQPDSPDFKLNSLATARSDLLCSFNGVLSQFSRASGPLHCLTGGSSSSVFLRSSDLSPSPGRTVTETLSCSLLKIVSSLQQPTSWSPPFPMPSSSLVSPLAVLHIWDLFLPEPPPLPDPPDPPDLASDSELVLCPLLSSDFLLESSHCKLIICFFEPSVVSLVYTWCCHFPCELQHLWYGSIEEQSFKGMVTSVEFTTFINQPPKVNKITSSSATLFHNPKRQKLAPTSPVTLTIMVNFTQTSSRQGRERSSSTSSLQERIFSPQSLFVRGNFHPVSKTWIIDDAGTSTSHSTTASFVASPLLAETLAMQNAMISAHICGIKSLSLEALLKKLPVFTYDSNRLTYLFNALVSSNVTSEFHPLALNSLLVTFV